MIEYNLEVNVQMLKEEIIKQPIPNKLVVLTFDDASISHINTVAPVLKKYGFGATFFICEFPHMEAKGERDECPGFENKDIYMSWKQIKELNTLGFEIGNHTLNHVHVNRVSDEKLNEEIDEIDSRCHKQDIPKPVSFAYPAYSTSESSLKILKNKGFLWARTGGGVYDPLKDHPLLIPSTHPSLNKNLDDFIKITDQAIDEKIVVLVIHGIPDDAHSWVSMEKEAFYEYMEYLHKNNFTVISMNQLSQYIDAKKAAELIEKGENQ